MNSPLEYRVAGGSAVTELTLLDHFAGQALTGILACPYTMVETDITDRAYQLAREMLASRALMIEELKTNA